MSINSIYPQIGKIIASTGSRQFPRLLHDLIQAHLCIDATQIRQLPRSPSETTVLDETVFSCDQATATASGDPSRLHRIRTSDARVEIRVLRADTTYGFSALERNRLEAITPLVLPMLEKHLRALQPTAQRNSHESLEQRFIERLAQTGLKLSERERQICASRRREGSGRHRPGGRQPAGRPASTSRAVGWRNAAVPSHRPAPRRWARHRAG